MARPVEATPTIIGDVAVETISLNDKGGSLAAVLKRSIRGQLKQGEPGFGAKLEFAPGVSAVFLAPSTFEEDEVGNKGQVLNILHISPGRYIIELEGLSKEEVDPVTKATLTIIEQMLREGKVGVVPADQFEQRIADAKRDGAELVTELKRKRRGPAMK